MKYLKYIIITIGLVVVLLIVFTYLSVWSKKDDGNISILPEITDVKNTDFSKIDTVLIAASTIYEGNLLKDLMQGSHYREAWATPVKAPVLNMDTYAGGLTVVDLGGGKQTKSIDLTDTKGRLHTLRSVNKDPQALVPKYAKVLGLENVINDGISAQHPYGALVAAKLSEVARIQHTHPKLFFVPKQERLDTLNGTFGNRLYLLEYETEGDVDWTGLKGVQQLVDTDKLQEMKMELKDKLTIDRPSLVRSRLFDFLIGDWDRHTKQWGWALQKNESEILAIPVAGDRDNAFFSLDGIIPTLVSSEYIEPKMRPFDEDIDYLEGLVYDFDIYFLKNTSEEIYLEQAAFLQNQLTDEQIDEALKIWPNKIYELDAPKIRQKIIHRRRDLQEYAKGYYRIIQQRPFLQEALVGSEDMSLLESLMKCFECMESSIEH